MPFTRRALLKAAAGIALADSSCEGNPAVMLSTPSCGRATSAKRWPYQITPYLSALPGVAGPGMDFGTDLPSKLYFITSNAETSSGGADANYGPNCFSGTFRYCWQADQGAGFHKFIIPLVGGYAYIGRRVTGPAGRGNSDYIGQAAPGAGLFIRCCGLRLGGGPNQRAWHLPSWLGDEPSASGVVNFQADTRDCLGSSQSGQTSSNTAWINCEARFAMDESAEPSYYAMDGISWIRGAVYDPLHVPPDFAMGPGSHHEAGQDHGYGLLIGGSLGQLTDNALVMQSLFAHTTDRNPLACGQNLAHVNNLHYNHGRPDDGRGAGCNIHDNQDVNEDAGKSMHCNLVGNITVMGPNQTATQAQLPVLATVTSASPGSTGHSKYNAQFGWVPVSSQDDFFLSKPVGYLQATLRSTAWPLGPDYLGALLPCVNHLAPSVQDGLEFAKLIRRTVGCKPNRRFLYEGGLHTVMTQIENKIRGATGSNEYVNTVDEAGGWPDMPVTSLIDPASPGNEWHAPMPLDSTRDDILLSGTFADGSSKVGYTKLRAWTIDQYFYVL